MKTFSRLSLLTLLLLGFAFMLAVDTVHAQQDQLEVYTAGGQVEYNVGDPVLVTFAVTPPQVVNLQVDWQGVNVTGITGATAPYAPGNYATSSLGGTLEIAGVITAPNAYISALWDTGAADDRRHEIIFNVVADDPRSEALEVYTGGPAEYNVGDPVEVTFVVRPTQVVPLQVDWQGVNVTGITGATAPYAPGNYATDSTLGSLVIKGVITGPNVYISALWDRSPADDLLARADLCCVINRPNAPIIVVNPPNPNSPLKVGDPFTQTIAVQDATDLAGWQMDIAFNPEVLEVIEIAEGDFLAQDGTDALFLHELSPGKISLKQVRLEGASGVSGSGVLAALTFRFVSFSEVLLGPQNVRLSDSLGERLSYSVTLTPVVVTHASAAAEDVNQDGWVDILDLVVVAGNIGTGRPHLYADVNDDGIVDVLDLVVIAGSPHWGRSVDSVQVEEPNATAPAVSVLLPTPETIREWITRAQVKSDGSLLFQRGIANLESLLVSKIPRETRLLLNYPNPFNPETWIPYQLSEASDVTVSIYAVDGRLIRTLALGHQHAGLYQSKNRAAYWDGRNAFGEPVASGLYCYTLTAGDFSATRKMLIRK